LVQASKGTGSELKVRRTSQNSRTRKKSPVENVFDSEKTRVFISSIQERPTRDRASKERPSIGARSSSGQREVDLPTLYNNLEERAKQALNE
jgi:hypothetical protein